MISNNDIAELFDADNECVYNDGDPVGICIDGLVRPFDNNTELKPVEYAGVVSLNPSFILGGITGQTSKVPVAISGIVRIWINGAGNLIGRKILFDKDKQMFRIFDKLFDSEYNGIIISVEETNNDKNLCSVLIK